MASSISRTVTAFTYITGVIICPQRPKIFFIATSSGAPFNLWVGDLALRCTGKLGRDQLSAAVGLAARYPIEKIQSQIVVGGFMFASEHGASLPKIVWNFDDTGFKSPRQSARDHKRAFFWSVLLVDLGPVQFAGSLQAFSTADT